MTSADDSAEEHAPWRTLHDLIRARDASGAQALIEGLPRNELPHTLSRLGNEESARLLEMLGPETGGALMETIPDAQATEVLTELEPHKAADIVAWLPSNEQADIIASLPTDEARAILQEMPPEEAAEAERLAKYEEGTAGSLMITEYLSFPQDVTVDAVLANLRQNTEQYQRHDVQYIYVTDRQGILRGVLRLRDLVLTASSTPVAEIMITDMEIVPVGATLERLRDFFATRAYRGVPVIDRDSVLVGVVRHADVAEAVGEREASDHLKAQGIVGGEELRSMPTFTRAWRRLSWLSINIVLNLIAASVIAFYQDTLSAVIVLAVFLPIISDMSGCSGNQAVAVSMREITLGLIRPTDALQVWGKELAVGLLNALALGTLLGVAAYLWQGNVYLSLVVGVALATNTIVAVSLGGLVPLFLRGMRLDPALASGPILTTVTDMCGFFLVLSLASATLQWIQ
ncbi:MAG: magnesium transporter [Polyangiales bacterium]